MKGTAMLPIVDRGISIVKERRKRLPSLSQQRSQTLDVVKGLAEFLLIRAT